MVMTTSENIGKGMKAISEHRFALAADLGQSNDPTAIAVIEHIKTFHVEYGGKEKVAEEVFALRHLQRLPLGMSYVDQMSRIAIMLEKPPLSQGCTWLLDETAIGRPTADIAERMGLNPIRVTITAGDDQTQKGARRFSVSKSVLVSGLDGRLHTGELKIAADLQDAGALREELRDFRRHVSAAGRFQFEARVGKHDDLVLATAIALWNFIGRPRTQPARIGRARFIPMNKRRA